MTEGGLLYAQLTDKLEFGEPIIFVKFSIRGQRETNYCHLYVSKSI